MLHYEHKNQVVLVGICEMITFVTVVNLLQVSVPLVTFFREVFLRRICYKDRQTNIYFIFGHWFGCLSNIFFVKLPPRKRPQKVTETYRRFTVITNVIN
jgi:hypothetical protein